MSAPIIALTTDFGVSSPYVAEMKAVLLSALADVRLVDLTHAVPAQSLRHAEVALRSAAFLFPIGTVHIVVVDPGVGTKRRPIAVTARGLSFVGPDNGVLGLALREPGARAICIDRPGLAREPLSATFHGRDLFAPVAAELAAGVPLEELGTLITDAVPSTLPIPVTTGDAVVGEVLVADGFGNLLTNIPARMVAGTAAVTVHGQSTRWVRTYGDGAPGELLALVGSDGYLEIAVRNGSAERALAATTGLEVRCQRKSQP
jgi:S-adenosyl-L-methionine hydrolase (adenosine-forming)